jgi:hypothetical protein
VLLINWGDEDLGGHPNPAIDGHRKTGHRELS